MLVALALATVAVVAGTTLVLVERESRRRHALELVTRIGKALFRVIVPTIYTKDYTPPPPPVAEGDASDPTGQLALRSFIAGMNFDDVSELRAFDTERTLALDPWGNPFQYRCSRDHTWSIYSFGPNGVDDGGRGDDVVFADRR